MSRLIDAIEAYEVGLAGLLKWQEEHPTSTQWLPGSAPDDTALREYRAAEQHLYREIGRALGPEVARGVRDRLADGDTEAISHDGITYVLWPELWNGVRTVLRIIRLTRTHDATALSAKARPRRAVVATSPRPTGPRRPAGDWPYRQPAS